MHVGEAGAVHHGAAAELPQVVGEDEAVEPRTFAEDIGPHHLERRGQVDVPQVGVAHEGFVADVAQTLGQRDAF